MTDNESEQIIEEVKARIDTMTHDQRFQCYELIQSIRSLCAGLDREVRSLGVGLVAAEIIATDRRDNQARK